MYLDEGEFEANVLRQGDILSAIHAIGALNLGSVQYAHTSTIASGAAISWTVPNPPILTYAMVLSHSCEIDPTNAVKLTSIILSPIRDINNATAPDKIEELKRSNIIEEGEEGTTASYLKYFYIAPNPKLPFPDGAIVDFSKCFSLRKNCYNLLAAKKVLQLKTLIADKMALKLSLYFYRRNPAE